MAWSATDVASVASGTDATTYSTGSYTPTASRLMVAAVENSKVGTPETPTLTGNGLTWTQVATEQTATNTRLTVFVALSGASPSAGAVTSAHGGATQISGSIDVVEVDGADLSGTALAAVVQSKTGGSASTATSGSVAMDNAPVAANRCFSAWVHAAQEASTPRASWTEIADLSHGTPGRGVETQWRSDAAEQTGSASWTTAATWGGVVMEIAAVAGQPRLLRTMFAHARLGRGGQFVR